MLCFARFRRRNVIKLVFFFNVCHPVFIEIKQTVLPFSVLLFSVLLLFNHYFIIVFRRRLILQLNLTTLDFQSSS